MNSSLFYFGCMDASGHFKILKSNLKGTRLKALMPDVLFDEYYSTTALCLHAQGNEDANELNFKKKITERRPVRC